MADFLQLSIPPLVTILSWKEPFSRIMLPMPDLKTSLLRRLMSNLVQRGTIFHGHSSYRGLLRTGWASVGTPMQPTCFLYSIWLLFICVDVDLHCVMSCVQTSVLESVAWKILPATFHKGWESSELHFRYSLYKIYMKWPGVWLAPKWKTWWLFLRSDRI